MLQLKNRTPFEGSLMPLPDQNGIDTLYAVVKGTFAIGHRLTIAEAQVPVVVADKHYGDPATTSIRLVSDLCLGKPGTDVLVRGCAWAPNEAPTWQTDVSVRVGSLTKVARVLGDRVWETGASGASMAWVAPFLRMPLVWERAFGGSDLNEKGSSADMRNPAGTGFRVSGGTKSLAGMALPNVEDPAAMVSSPSDRPAPMGFAPIAPHWEPRKSFAGTYDEAWQQRRAPYLPADFDARFFQVAPPGLVTPGFLQGGEPVDIRGATASGILQFVLPEVRVQFTYRQQGAETVRFGVLDTVLIEPDEQRLVLVWRAALSCDKQLLKVREVEATLLTAH
jgi:hypothetical protein